MSNNTRFMSTRSILARLNSDYDINISNWRNYAIMWIWERLRMIGHGVSVEETKRKFNVCDYKFAIPKYITNVLGVKYLGKRLEKRGATKWIGLETEEAVSYDGVTASLFNCPQDTTHYYLHRGNSYLDFSFQDGEVEIFYQGFITDCDGFIMVPNEPEFTEALMWWVLYKLIGRGFKHPSYDINYIEAKAQEWKSKAKAIHMFPNPDEFNEIMNNFNTTIPNNFLNE